MRLLLLTIPLLITSGLSVAHVDNPPIMIAVRCLSCTLEMDHGGSRVSFLIASAKRSAQNIIPWNTAGSVRTIVFNPEWYPTDRTRRDYLFKYNKELPRVIPAKDPRNALGRVAIYLDFPGCSVPLRIHDTNEYGSIGTRSSRGCVRMRRSDVDSIARSILRSALESGRMGPGDAERARRILAKPLDNVEGTIIIRIPTDIASVKFEAT